MAADWSRSNGEKRSRWKRDQLRTWRMWCVGAQAAGVSRQKGKLYLTPAGGLRAMSTEGRRHLPGLHHIKFVPILLVLILGDSFLCLYKLRGTYILGPGVSLCSETYRHFMPDV